MTDDTSTNLERFIRAALGEHGALLDDPEIMEMSANPNGTVFVVRLSRAPDCVGHLDEEIRNRIIRFCATARGIPVTPQAPIVSARIPGPGYRFEGVIPPCAPAPLFSIRFHASRVFTMAEYIEAGTLDTEQAARLRKALRSKENIVVAGGTGSGKTTFLNMLVGEAARLAPDERPHLHRGHAGTEHGASERGVPAHLAGGGHDPPGGLGAAAEARPHHRRRNP